MIHTVYCRACSGYYLYDKALLVHTFAVWYLCDLCETALAVWDLCDLCETPLAQHITTANTWSSSSTSRSWSAPCVKTFHLTHRFPGACPPWRSPGDKPCPDSWPERWTGSRGEDHPWTTTKAWRKKPITLLKSRQWWRHTNQLLKLASVVTTHNQRHKTHFKGGSTLLAHR